MPTSSRRSVISWAMYDWANSAFATTVMAGFFPLFFKQYWSQGVEVTQSTYYLGISNSVASLIVVILAPSSVPWPTMGACESGCWLHLPV
ncbi:MAG: hypothetical protein Ct9H300mP16_17330 [Pseudomonadota bacterium]|nr:MAG: hypothetical protein Ct9H300mP16_17330 [Pseudomonadota bacterium]